MLRPYRTPCAASRTPSTGPACGTRSCGATPSRTDAWSPRATAPARTCSCGASPTSPSNTSSTSTNLHQPPMSNLHLFDLLVIAGYFLVLLGIGYWAARREKNVSADYFLASRDVGWFAVGASLFASNIGSEHLVGLAGTGAASGLAVGHFEWLACLILLLLGWLFVPFYLRSGVYTMPEFLERRFNSASRGYFTWVSIIGYVLTKISVTLFAGGVVMREVTGYSVWTSAVILIIITGLYTVLGGLRAVIYTEVMQAVVLIIGSATMALVGLQAVGGWR